MDYLNQLPWGFTFSPTDEELICYLEAKSKNSTLPFVDPVIDFDVYIAQHPSQLHMQQRLNVSSTHLYFYVEKSGIGRKAGNGFWHANTGGTKVVNHHGEVIGQRTSLVYYMYDSPVNDEKKDNVIEKEDKKNVKSPSTRTNWIMNEFRLLHSKSKSKSSSKGPMWTICKIGETGRTFGGNIHHQVVPPSEQVIHAADQPQQQQLQHDHDNYMGLMEFEEQQQYDQFQQMQPQQLDNIDENAQQFEQHNRQQWQCDIDDLIGSVPHHQASDQIEQLEQYHPQFEERQQHHDDQIFIDQYDHQQMQLQFEQQQWKQHQNCNNVPVPQGDSTANQHRQLQQLDHGDGLDDDLRCLLEHSNALQQYDEDENGIPEMLWLDEDENGIPEMLWLDEAQLVCDGEGNLLNPRPTKRARL